MIPGSLLGGLSGTYLATALYVPVIEEEDLEYGEAGRAQLSEVGSTKKKMDVETSPACSGR